MIDMNLFEIKSRYISIKLPTSCYRYICNCIVYQCLGGNSSGQYLCDKCFAFILFTRKRYQAILDLNAQIDSILHGEYNINLIPDEEGELAVLCSELSKMTLRMRSG